MKFKIGDTVTIKQLTIKDIYHPLYMPDDMTKYQEQTGQITFTDLVTCQLPLTKVSGLQTLI